MSGTRLSVSLCIIPLSRFGRGAKGEGQPRRNAKIILGHPLSAICYFLAIVVLFFFPICVSGDIYQWEWIDPAHPELGKQQSTTICPGGAGVNAVPSAELGYRNLTKAYLIGANLTNASIDSTNLTIADLTSANLTYADFSYATLSGAVLNNAEVRGASFGNTTGFSQAKLQSTASYQAKDLSGIKLNDNNLSGWDLHQQNLTKANLSYSWLTSANLTQANLTNAGFFSSWLTGVILDNAQIRGATFSYTTSKGFTETQLKSTASYQAKDLSGIQLGNNDLSGWDFSGQNLKNAFFSSSTLTGAIFDNADVRGAFFSSHANRPGGLTLIQLQSTASYKVYDLSGIYLYGLLNGWDFQRQNLTNARFDNSDLINANFTDAIVQGAWFNLSTPDSTSITEAQLKSTSSYKDKNLIDIGLCFCDLTGWDFHLQNLSGALFRRTILKDADLTDAVVENADFRGTTSKGFIATQLYSTASYKTGDLTGINLDYNDLSGWNFANQILAEASFYESNLSNTNFTGADMRGTYTNYVGAVTLNAICYDGKIQGLDLSGGQTLIVRDYDGDPSRSLAPISIKVQNGMTMGTDGKLQMIFEEDAWDSTISFDPGISVALGGTLEMTFADGVDISGQIGRTFSLFDWSGVSPTGAFNVESPYLWNLSNLYTSGDVTLLAIPEPATVTMLLLAIVFLTAFIRKRSPG